MTFQKSAKKLSKMVTKINKLNTQKQTKITYMNYLLEIYLNLKLGDHPTTMHSCLALNLSKNYVKK